MKIQIRSRFDDSILFEYDQEDNTIKLTVEAAVKDGVNLYGANLYKVNLYGANLYGANLERANLAKANLAGANLERANLARTNLEGANLAGAYLDGANLNGAYIDVANLNGVTYGIGTLNKGLLQLLGMYWSVMILDAHIKIGCKLYSTVEWAEFDDATIAKIGSNADKFWKKNKEFILLAAKTHQE